MSLLSTLTVFAQKCPESVAIVDRHGILTYGELESAVLTRAGELERSEVPHATVVGISADRDRSVVIDVLATLRSGRVPLMLDRLYPRAYQKACLELVRAAAVLSPGEPVQVVNDSSSWTILEAGDAYVSFTSGTSGRPRAVVATWAALDNYFDWAPERFDDRNLARFALLSGLSHDPFWRDVLTPLTGGATLYLPSRSQWASGPLLAAYLVEHEIQAFSCTPTQMSALTRSAAQGTASSLRRVLLGGEPLFAATALAARRWGPRASFFNVYGLTETPQVAAFSAVSDSDLSTTDPLPIGVPAPGFAFAISAHGTLQIVAGPIGRAVLDGDGPMRALPRPFDTADLARRVDAGYMVHGRRDRVVNIRGARVDLAMVEAHIIALAGVTACRAYVRNGELEADMFVAPAERDITAEQVRRALIRNVPLPAVPAQIHVEIRDVRTTPNGKIA